MCECTTGGSNWGCREEGRGEGRGGQGRGEEGEGVGREGWVAESESEVDLRLEVASDAAVAFAQCPQSCQDGGDVM